MGVEASLQRLVFLTNDLLVGVCRCRSCSFDHHSNSVSHTTNKEMDYLAVGLPLLVSQPDYTLCIE